MDSEYIQFVRYKLAYLILLPSLLMIGDWTTIATSCISATIGVMYARGTMAVAVFLNAFLIDCTGKVALPGLINSHDHLEFNLFPRLGHGPYPNYKDWAADVYRPSESPLREHLAVPKTIRLWWGGLKNLLSGVTTVCHHNPYVAEVFENSFPVSVIKRFRWSHSVAFGKGFGPPDAGMEGAPYIIHAGEGTDEQSAEEVYILDRLGLLDSHTVVVHGVAAERSGLALLGIRGAGRIWCPTSNVFTLGRTLGHESGDRQAALVCADRHRRQCLAQRGHGRGSRLCHRRR